MKLLFLIMLLGGMAFGQQPPPTGLIGLPNEGVLLTGTLDHPVIENHTKGRTIMAYTIDYIPQGVAETVSAWQIWNRDKMIRPGQSREVVQNNRAVAGVTVMPPGQAMRGVDPFKHTAAILDAVVFSNGEVVGRDSTRTLERLQEHFDRQHRVHQILLNEGWTKIEEMAQSPEQGKDRESYFAQMLIAYRKQQGDEAAMKLAHTTEQYPRLFKSKKGGIQ